MGIKQLRLNSPPAIKQRLNEFLGKKINIVLANNTVVFGEIKTITGDIVIMKNMRQKNIRFAIRDIVELYADYNS